MPLDTTTYTIAEALDEIDDQIDEISETLVDLTAGTDRYEALVDRAQSLEYRADGLTWMRDEGEWGEDAEITLGALTAGERAKMERQITDGASVAERRLWFVAAGTEEAPYAGGDLAATFENLVDVHDGYLQWGEAQLNELSTPGNATQRLQTSLSEMQTEQTSPSADGSTT